ncbi:MAG: tetratricopeptide repeat protein [Acidobacteria bacterium]|nr:tetratricopeptide repeat protein [Acidobacteriota bacterium]
MKAESIVFAIAGSLFGLIVGWILGAQQAIGTNRATPPPAVQQAAAANPAANPGTPPAAPLDEGRAQAMRNVAEQNPRDAQPRVQLGNMYFDAERYTDAISWYEEAIKLAPSDPNLSTDLGVAYYYTNQPDKAVAQFERSLSVDPKHSKTLLNLGIVKAFGKQDLNGAAQAWQQVVALAPNSPEGQAAKKALEGLQTAHPTTPPGPGSE